MEIPEVKETKEAKETKEMMEIDKNINHYSLINNMIYRQIERKKKIKDPVTRNMIIAEIFVSLVDIVADMGIINLKSSLDRNISKVPEGKRDLYEKKTDEVVEKIQKTRDDLNQLMDSFSEWILQPIYSVDHPVGKSMMKEAKEEFSSASKEQK